MAGYGKKYAKRKSVNLAEISQSVSRKSNSAKEIACMDNLFDCKIILLRKFRLQIMRKTRQKHRNCDSLKWHHFSGQILHENDNPHKLPLYYKFLASCRINWFAKIIIAYNCIVYRAIIWNDAQDNFLRSSVITDQ